MSKRKTCSAEFFSRLAVKGWRRNAFFTFTWGYPHLRRWIVSQFSSQEKIILSAGCGSGELERELKKSNHLVIGIDNAHRMARLALQRGLKNVIQANACFLPFRARYFDVVIFPESIGYLDMAKAFSEARRVLKTNGRAIITAYTAHMHSDDFYNKSSLAQIAAQLRRAGFRILDVKMLKVNTRNIREVAAEECSNLLYISGRKTRRRT